MPARTRIPTVWWLDACLVHCLWACIDHQPARIHYPRQGDERLRLWQVSHGEAIVEWEDGEHIHYTAGEGFVLRPWQRYRQSWSDRATARTSGGWFLLQSRDGLDPLAQYHFPRRITAEQLRPLIAHCAQIENLPAKVDLSVFLQRQSHVHAVLHGILQLGHGSDLQPDSHLQDLVSFMREHLHRSISRSELAARLNCSEATLYKRFQTNFHVGPSEYLRRLRLERAKTLLLQEGRNLEQIADSCGFADAAHLSRSFKHSCGLSPSQWRRQQHQLT